MDGWLEWGRNEWGVGVRPLCVYPKDMHERESRCVE